MAEIPILLLAAGSSSRMGHPKQLLPWGKHTLIQHQIENLLKTGNPLAVVLGANADLIIPVIRKYKIEVFINPNWENGMGSSIAHGIKYLTEKFPGADGVLIALSDQPLVTTSHYRNLLNSFQPKLGQIIVSQSASGWTGVPALFDPCYFEELARLNGSHGARKIISQYPSKVTGIESGELLEDIDTPETYRKMQAYFSGKP